MTVGPDDLFAGVPELAVVVSVSISRRDLGHKFRAYGRAGVQEYLVIRPRDGELEWFANGTNGFHPLDMGGDRLIRSQVFPGLWLDPAALFADDLAALVATVQRGCQTPEHAAFIARLNATT